MPYFESQAGVCIAQEKQYTYFKVDFDQTARDTFQDIQNPSEYVNSITDCTMTDQIKFTAELLFNKFQAITLTTKQLSEVIPRSEVSLRRDRMHKVGIPYTQFATKGKNVALYNIYDIAEFLLSNRLKVA